jgi:hypothetical protein
MSKLIVAVCGLAGSGKDMACDYLVRTHGFKKTSFAAPLKQMVKIAFGFTDEQLYGPSEKREEQDERYPFSGVCPACGQKCEAMIPTETVAWHCHPCNRDYPMFINARVALQTLGTEWGRRLSSNIWANAGVNHMLENEGSRWCLSDLRFKNEFQAVKNAGGFVVRLMRGHVQHNHASETELLSIPLSDFDMVIHNHGELSKLFIGLDATVREFNNKKAGT